MHLLNAEPGQIDDAEPVDMAQSPADVVFLSAADTELAALAQARAEMGEPPSLRLGNLAYLRHPMSVDLHLDKCATGSRLVIVRALGGVGYWQYGIEQYAIRLGEAAVPFVALPGDDKPDEELFRLSTVSRKDWENLLAYFVEGGPENARNLLAYARDMVAEDARAAPGAKPLLRAGLYWPGSDRPTLDTLRAAWAAPGAGETDHRPVVPVVFYRALLEGAGLNPINQLTEALLKAGLAPMPVFVASLKDPLSAATLGELFSAAPPAVIINCTSFATGTAADPGVGSVIEGPGNPLTGPAAEGAPVFQAILSGGDETAWRNGTNGLSARDIAMNVALPEVDGRVLARAISFKGQAFYDEATQAAIATYRAQNDRIEFTVGLVAAWVRLRATVSRDRRVAFVLANYPNKDGRLANGVGLDTPQATVDMLSALAEEGYQVTDPPATSQALMAQMMDGPTNWLTDRVARAGGERLSLDDYRIFYQDLPFEVRLQIEDRWGQPEADPFLGEDGFALAIHRFGHAVVALQPARGYNVDPKDTYHAPDLVPPHNYLAFYAWLRQSFGAHAVVHMGKHGNLEWLPGKAVALSGSCWPEVALGPVPHIYPFIVNDPGEGTQAKRRASAVIVDHLTPPLTRAETYGPLRDLEALVDEYYDAAGVDPRRLDHLRREILALSTATGIDADAGMEGRDEAGDLAKLDAYLCDLKEAQIRDGLHVFGSAPEGRLERDLIQALVRVPRHGGSGGNASLQRAIAADLGLDFDPLDCDMAAPWDGPRPAVLAVLDPGRWRSTGDTVERVEILAAQLLDGDTPADAPAMPATAEVLVGVKNHIRPTLRACGPGERSGGGG
ncbi:MAG: cobaltochelatase subunit CobN, partial [Pseudomonadota bacterium]